MFKIISWNVNGIRAALGRGLAGFVTGSGADVVCLQETKALPEQAPDADFAGYEAHWNPAEKRGYSGVASFARPTPVAVRRGMGTPRHDREGRVVTLEFPGFHLVNVYTPNAQRDLARLDYRLDWEKSFRRFVKKLDADKPVILCGDLNVAHEEIDLRNPKSNRRNAGFTDEERAAFSRLLADGFVDAFRALHPGEPDHYTWWSYRGGARERNVGWRIDYVCVSERLMPRVGNAAIHPDVGGSDHCPVSLEIDL